MDNTLMMDVSGAWVRKPEASSAEQMNALADEKERQFVARWLGDSSQESKDACALAELIQWVRRSRVRKGQPITLCPPT